MGGKRWWLLLGGRGGGSCRVGRRSGAASAVGACGLVVEEVEATAKAEWVIVLVVVDLALSLSPELVRILRYAGPAAGGAASERRGFGSILLSSAAVNPARRCGRGRVRWRRS